MLKIDVKGAYFEENHYNIIDHDNVCYTLDCHKCR